MTAQRATYAGRTARSVRRLVLAAALATGLAPLGGCAGGLHSETVVIPDAAESATAATDGANATFAVQSIYRLPFDAARSGAPIGWADGDRLVGFERDDALQVVELTPPYRDPIALGTIDADPLGLSPDGRYLLGIAKSVGGNGGGLVLRLVSTTDGRAAAEVPLLDYAFRKRRFDWSDNGRYLAYGARGADSKVDDIAIYDTSTGEQTRYKLTGGGASEAADTIQSVKPSGDGARALIVYTALDGAVQARPASDGAIRSYVMLAERSGDAYVSRYEHPLGGAGSAEWVNDSQIAFSGADDTLFGYDIRNGALTVLAEQAGLFSLSPDKQAIAFARGADDTVVAGRLQGNNVLSESVVYQGIIPDLLAWSSDGDKLLVQGKKPYARSQSAAEMYPQPEAEAAPLMGDGDYGSFVLQFR